MKIFFLFINQNICCGYSKEPSQWDGSFEHSQHVFKLIDKKMVLILLSKILSLDVWMIGWKWQQAPNNHTLLYHMISHLGLIMHHLFKLINQLWFTYLVLYPRWISHTNFQRWMTDILYYYTACEFPIQNFHRRTTVLYTITPGLSPVAVATVNSVTCLP